MFKAESGPFTPPNSTATYSETFPTRNQALTALAKRHMLSTTPYVILSKTGYYVMALVTAENNYEPPFTTYFLSITAVETPNEVEDK